MSITPDEEEGTLEVLMERLNKQRLPHALALEKKVNQGEKLNDYDIEFLTEVVQDVRRVKPIYERHPDYRDLLVKLMSLYTHIINRAAENEGKQPAGST